MATTKTSGLVPTNTTAGVPVSLTALGLSTNYAKKVSAKNSLITLTNRTTGLDSDEIIQISGRRIPRIDNALQINSTEGATYTVELNTPIRTTVDSDNCDCQDTVVDDPVVVTIKIRHPLNSNVTVTMLEQCLRRALSVFYHDDGTTRINDFAKLTFEPQGD